MYDKRKIRLVDTERLTYEKDLSYTMAGCTPSDLQNPLRPDHRSYCQFSTDPLHPLHRGPDFSLHSFPGFRSLYDNMNPFTGVHRPYILDFPFYFCLLWDRALPTDYLFNIVTLTSFSHMVL